MVLDLVNGKLVKAATLKRHDYFLPALIVDKT